MSEGAKHTLLRDGKRDVGREARRVLVGFEGTAKIYFAGKRNVLYEAHCPQFHPGLRLHPGRIRCVPQRRNSTWLTMPSTRAGNCWSKKQCGIRMRRNCGSSSAS